MTTMFAAGTCILTARGEVLVETLHDGDAVETVSGAFCPVMFLGRFRVNCARHPKPRNVWPVRVRANAFADGVPRRDLLLSPGHAVYIDDVLIPICSLINGATIVQEATDEVVYWYVELPADDVIFAEDLPCESHADAGSRSAFGNGGKVVRLHPDFTAPVRETDDPGRLAITSEAVSKVRRYLLDRAHRRGIGNASRAARESVQPG